MRVAAAGAAMASAASPLLSGDFRYGFDYDSYIWRGFGMFTQLAAMHLSFVTVAVAWSALRSRRRADLVWLALALAALVLTHPIYAYMMAITLGILALVGADSRADIAPPLVLFVTWLVLYFGRPTLDGLVSLFPMHDGLLLHRFSGSVELLAIVLIGIGAAWAYELLTSAFPQSLRVSPSLRVVLAGVVALLLLAPAMAERASFYASNAPWIRQPQAAIDSDVDARTILSSLRTRAPGRVF